MEKLVLALVHATRRLRRYFQAHPVVVITDHPIKQILSRPKNTRRMLKWKFELEAFDITYRPRTSIRGQILADFIAERLDEEGPSVFGGDTKKKVNRRKGNPSSGGRRRVLLDDTVGRIPYGRKSFLEPWLRCIGPTQAEYVVIEIHEGSCSMHSGPRSVVTKAIRFKLPGEIISENRKQFRDNPFKDWCEKLNIKQSFAFVKHPQTNDQVERANRSLGEGIKSRLGEVQQELVNQAKNDNRLLLNLDILEERREKAVVREARSKAKMEKYYNAKVRSTSFRPRDFVYRSNEASHAKESGKLGLK
ncbi:reverse transcriptase domain-containing protein [Tanacetum coccineum]|uniref:Reverse transcriptase domain-containing protein n=1 Tax=Tanacetum coccineum TaxID=301880 RepID=A0ABQ5I3N1_9ASTR